MLICIDPGHGGRDPGAVGPSGLRESYVTLRLAEMVGGRLVEHGHTVHLTRTVDVYVGLPTRAAIANDADADLFLSIHCNAFQDSRADGSETLYHPNSSAGEQWARYVQAAVVARGGRRDRGVKGRSDLCVLRETSMPAILVEAAFISHPDEERLLRSEAWLRAVAEAIAGGTAAYLAAR